MKDIDWYYLRRPLIIFFSMSLVGLALFFAGYQFEKQQLDRYEQSRSTLQSTHRLYRNIINDIDLLEQYRNLYSEYKSSGLIGDERRLSWVESLKSTNDVLKLPVLTYQLQPQEPFVRPGFKIQRGVLVNSSPMDLNIGMLHEEDLFALIEGLRLSIKNLFTVDRCRFERTSKVSSSLGTKKANMNTACTIRWVTINAQ